MGQQGETDTATRDRLVQRRAALSPSKLDLLQRLVATGSTTPSVVIPRRNADGPTPLSFAQQRIWFLDQLVPNSPAYAVPFALHLRGNLDHALLQRALAEIVRRHEILRTTFR